jgi:hypothetical protein
MKLAHPFVAWDNIVNFLGALNPLPLPSSSSIEGFKKGKSKSNQSYHYWVLFFLIELSACSD